MTRQEPQECVLLKYGELALKGRNRGLFERHLLQAVEHAMRTDGEQVRISRREGVLVLSHGLPRHELMERAVHVFGVSVVQPALRTACDVGAATEAVLLALAGKYGDHDRGARTFAIRARRRNKTFPMTSHELAAHIGERVRDVHGWRVDLGQPDVEVVVEADKREVFVSLERHRGQGGLPAGASGRALVLLSGGYDSPVAAHRAMRRGLRCEFVHFSGAPYTDPSSTYKAYALLRELDRYQGRSRLHVVAIGKAQRALATAGAGKLQVIAQRRLMVRLASELARELNAQALVTGDSIGQVASQTLSNLATVEQASSVPVLRPLLTWDKSEIIAEAERIGTADISALPDEDCCALLAPPRVATRTGPGEFEGIEGRVELAELVPKLLADAQVLTVGGTRSQAGPLA
ncbi:tRNA 4-thiouridine(8) synthase ThiI [Prauserella marina]|uniref:Probable tRNA sulfurtransferase n=1 Tax=Prauserella marina TaxID=530584 RepID=A0A222VTV5_9PSEU|nr:tRNA uracil 4-sulfurtransferase ThiI [Prauserella marina]ASR37349.1 tRNA 4-thiouridine(8) synthase ThiI [Prauserella marina]PWV74788.1 thiamine biosynthesis protein ThiI [Prauserella marina]SDD40678.1 thiamine biosynthesis protein ThiI [Prauserella marina]